MKTYLTILFSSLILSLDNTSLAQDSLDEWSTLVSVADLKSDFEQLYAGLKSGHANNYVHRPKAEYDAHYATLLADINQAKSLFDTQVLFQKFVAFGNVAHANITFPEPVYRDFRDNNGPIFPIYLRIVRGQAFVGENYSESENVNTGDAILEINGVSMSDWLERAAGHISADTPYIAHSLLEFTFPKYLWLEGGEVTSYRLTLQTGNEEPRFVNISAKTESEMQAAALKRTKIFSLSSDTRTSKMLTSTIAYLRPGPFYNIDDPTSAWDNTSFTKFIDSAFTSFIENSAQTLIIDLRANPGGDNSFSDHMVAWFADQPFRFASGFLIKSSDQAAASNQIRLDANPGATEGVSYLFARQYAKVPRGKLFSFEIPYVKPRIEPRFQGEVIVLINRHSYSNAVNVAAIVQDYGFGSIAGEKTSDMATTYGAMETFQLKQTGITVNFPKAHIIRPSGDKLSDGVTPDKPIETPIVSSQNDTVLDDLLSHLNGGERQTIKPRKEAP